MSLSQPSEILLWVTHFRAADELDDEAVPSLLSNAAALARSVMLGRPHASRSAKRRLTSQVPLVWVGSVET